MVLGVGLLLPYVLRPAGRASTQPPYLGRLRPHYLAGLLAMGLALAHGYASMLTPAARHANMTGLWLATGALGLLFLQATVGQTLRRPQLTGRRSLRAIHFWIATALVGLIFAHICLNR